MAASRLFVASMGATLMVGDPTWPGMMDCPMHWKKFYLEPQTVMIPTLLAQYCEPSISFHGIQYLHWEGGEREFNLSLWLGIISLH